MVQWVIDHVLGAPAWVVYAVVGAFVFIEDAVFVGFVIPGETVAVLGGATARLGHTELALVLLVVVAAAIIGDSVGYEVGKKLGPSVLNHRILTRHRGRLDSAQDFLRERGGSAVFLGRWTAFFRAVMPALAGVSRMPYRRFLPWNAIGGLTWGVVVVLVGYAAGAGFERAASVIGRGSAVAVGVVAVGAFLVIRHRRRREQVLVPEPSPLPEPSALPELD